MQILSVKQVLTTPGGAPVQPSVTVQPFVKFVQPSTAKCLVNTAPKKRRNGDERLATLAYVDLTDPGIKTRPRAPISCA